MRSDGWLQTLWIVESEIGAVDDDVAVGSEIRHRELSHVGIDPVADRQEPTDQEAAEQPPETLVEEKVRLLAQRAQERGFEGAASNISEFADQIRKTELEKQAELRAQVEAALSEYTILLGEAIRDYEAGADTRKVAVPIDVESIFDGIPDSVGRAAFRELLGMIMTPGDRIGFMDRIRIMVRGRKEETNANGSYVDSITNLGYRLTVTDEQNKNLVLTLGK